MHTHDLPSMFVCFYVPPDSMIEVAKSLLNPYILTTKRTSSFSTVQPRVETGRMKFVTTRSKRLNQLPVVENFHANRAFNMLGSSGSGFILNEAFNRWQCSHSHPSNLCSSAKIVYQSCVLAILSSLSHYTFHLSQYIFSHKGSHSLARRTLCLRCCCRCCSIFSDCLG